MLHYEFLPLEARDGQIGDGGGRPHQPGPPGRIGDEAGQALVVRVAAPSQVRDFLKKTEPSQRVLDDATEEFRLDVIRDEEAAGEGLSLEQLVEETEVSPMIRLVDSIIFAGTGAAGERHPH